MKQGKQDDGFRMSDALWEQMEPLLPAPKPHPLGCHRPRVPNRAAMDAILLVLRTGMQWNALDGTGICTCSSAYRRFREWIDAGVFAKFWRMGLLEYDELQGIDWSWLAMDGTMTKAPLGGKKKPVRTHATAPKAASSAACSLKLLVFRWRSRLLPPTGMT